MDYLKIVRVVLSLFSIGVNVWLLWALRDVWKSCKAFEATLKKRLNQFNQEGNS